MRVLSIGQLRYWTSISGRVRSSTRPCSSISRIDTITLKISSPMAPAFIRSAPPTLPGMPSRNSSPARPRRFASTATALRRAPAPQLRCSPATSMRPNCGCDRQITTPRNPPSLISRFEPRPRRRSRRFCSEQNLITAPSSSVETGSRYRSAGPPTRKVVRRASGSFRRMIVRGETRRRSSSAMSTRFCVGRSSVVANEFILRWAPVAAILFQWPALPPLPRVRRQAWALRPKVSRAS